MYCTYLLYSYMYLKNNFILRVLQKLENYYILNHVFVEMI